MEFKPGDKVTWTSQATGSSKTKTGILLGIVEPEQDAYKYVPLSIRKNRIKGQNHSSIVRAAVEVPRSGQGIGSDYYFPRLSAIKKVD